MTSCLSYWTEETIKSQSYWRSKLILWQFNGVETVGHDGLACQPGIKAIIEKSLMIK